MSDRGGHTNECYSLIILRGGSEFVGDLRTLNYLYYREVALLKRHSPKLFKHVNFFSQLIILNANFFMTCAIDMS